MQYITLIGGGIGCVIVGYALLKAALRQEANLGGSVGEVARAAVRRIAPGVLLVTLGIGITGVGGKLVAGSPQVVMLEIASLVQLANAFQHATASGNARPEGIQQPLVDPPSRAVALVPPIPQPITQLTPRKAGASSTPDRLTLLLGPQPANPDALRYWRGCRAGNAQDCNDLGATYFEGQNGVEKNPERGTALFEFACNSGDPLGCANLGDVYRDGAAGLSKDPARAVGLYRGACDSGDAKGCGQLGRAYFTGEGVPADQARGAALSQQACEGGLAMGCDNLGVAYFYGVGVPQDVARAITLYRQACNGGMAEACDRLKQPTNQIPRGAASDSALDADTILGPQPDDPTAGAAWRGCNGGNAVRCAQLARLVLDGKGVPKDQRLADQILLRALAFFQRDCGAGDGRACVMVGTAYAYGEGLPKNTARAAALFEKGCVAGVSQGCEALRQLRNDPDK